MNSWIRIRMVVAALALAGWTGTSAAQVSPDKSFYVPQAGLDYNNPLEGTDAIPYFRACPNNDGDGSLPLDARIKVVVRDANDAGIKDIAASDICILFNGGPPVQGYTGNGADSVIANSTYNPAFNCPDVRCVQADGPTDADGVTYITFTGAGGVRDPNRKWGHYDSVLPVYVLGVPIQGRITSNDNNGTYVLQIKNFDQVGGLTTILNTGEIVNSNDINAVQANIVAPPVFWRDFDGDLFVTIADLNMVLFHNLHRCNSPNNP